MFALLLALLLPATPDLATVRELFAAQRYAEAQEMAESLLPAKTDDPALHQLLGQLARKRRDLPAAVRHLARASQLAPDHAAIQYDYGAACGLLADRSGASLRALGLARRSRTALARAVELDPANVAYREALIEFYATAPVVAGGGLSRARGEAEALRQLDARAGTFALATVLERQGRPAELLVLWREQYDRYPDDYEILYHFGRATARAGDQLGAGRDALNRCLSLPPSPRAPGHAWVHAALAQVHAAREDWPAARAAYADALALDDRPTSWHEALAALPEN